MTTIINIGELLGIVPEGVAFTKKFFDGKVPEYKNPSEADLEFEQAIKELPDKVGELISEMKFREGLVEIILTAKKGNKYFNDQEPWKAVKEDMEKALAKPLEFNHGNFRFTMSTTLERLEEKLDNDYFHELFQKEGIEDWRKAQLEITTTLNAKSQEANSIRHNRRKDCCKNYRYAGQDTCPV